MKNLPATVLIAFLAVFSLTACKDDKKADPKPSFPPFQNTGVFGPKANILTGGNTKTWKFQNLLVNGQPLSPLDMPCVNGTRLTFYKVNHLYTTSVPFGMDCSSTNGNWNMNETETELRVYPMNGSPIAWQIIELTDSMFHYIAPATVNGAAAASEAWMVPE